MKRSSLNCDELWRIWYVILNSILHGFLLYVGLSRYLSFKSLVFDPKYGGNWSHFGLNFYLALTIAGLVSYVFFLYVCLIKTNNFANEGIQIGRDTDNLLFVINEDSDYPIKEFLDASMSKPDNYILSGHPNSWNGKKHEIKKPVTFMKNLSNLYQRLKVNFLPYSSFIHVIIAFLLYLPLPIFEAQQIYHRALSENYLWNNDLSLIFQHDISQERIAYLNDPESSKEIVTIQPNFYDTTTTSSSVSMSTEDLMYKMITDSPVTPRPMSPEFFNVIFSLLLLCMRYPAVFWYTNKIFAFIFAILLIVCSVQIIIELCVINVLVKMAINSHIVSFTRRNVKLKETLSRIIEEQQHITNENITVNNLSYMILSVIGSFIMLIAFYMIFEYGKRQFSSNMTAYRQYLCLNNNNNSLMTSQMGMQKTGNCSCCFHNYTPHIFAMILTIIIIVVKTPIFLASLEIYRNTGSHLMLTGMMTSLVYLFLWLASWFAFRLKPSWQFKVNLPIQSTDGILGNSDLGPLNSYTCTDPNLIHMGYTATTLPHGTSMSYQRQNSLSCGLSNIGSNYLPTIHCHGSLNRQHSINMSMLNETNQIYSCFHDDLKARDNNGNMCSDNIYVSHQYNTKDAFNKALEKSIENYLPSAGNQPSNSQYFPYKDHSDEVYTKHHFQQQSSRPISTNLINHTASITGSVSNASSSLATAIPNNGSDQNNGFNSSNEYLLSDLNQAFAPQLAVYQPQNPSLSSSSIKLTESTYEKRNNQIISTTHKSNDKHEKLNKSGTQDCSPNSSEPGSHNTISSDSGIENKKNSNVNQLLKSTENGFIGLTDGFEIPALKLNYYRDDAERSDDKEQRVYSQV